MVVSTVKETGEQSHRFDITSCLRENSGYRFDNTSRLRENSSSNFEDTSKVAA